MGWKYKKIDIFEAVEIVKASPNEFVTQDVKIRNCVRAEICWWNSNNCTPACHSLDWDEQGERWLWAECKCREYAKEFE